VRLPGLDNAVLDAGKVRHYLLAHTHPVGRFKASFFVSLGYSALDWERLAADLLRHAIEYSAVPRETSQYGQKYEVRGTLTGPADKSAVLVTIWIVRCGEDFPRFVTAFPGTGP
jgi:hypothetical protein